MAQCRGLEAGVTDGFASGVKNNDQEPRLQLRGLDLLSVDKGLVLGERGLAIAET